jgi:TPP-dependent pyruvate/acetoin dehydrogenase alpha subunit
MSGIARPIRESDRALLRCMLLIRRMEEQLSALTQAGALPGGVHLTIGQEAVAAGVCTHLRADDAITSNHRGHGHFLAKGGSPAAMMAEIFGRANGVCHGMGGSMHVADISKGMLGANGIVGAGLAIAAGAAWAAKLDGGDRVAVCFFGDGAANQGVFMETLNITSLWKLPMVFVCENNRYAEFSPAATVTSGELIDRARAFSIPCTRVDGNDVLAVTHAAAQAIAHARSGAGPAYIEADTYRMHGHLESEKSFLKGSYRADAEVEAWRERCPIQRFIGELRGQPWWTAAMLADLEAEISRTVADAVAFAEAGPPADPGLVFDIMFSEQRA